MPYPLMLPVRFTDYKYCLLEILRLGKNHSDQLRGRTIEVLLVLCSCMISLDERRLVI